MAQLAQKMLGSDPPGYREVFMEVYYNHTMLV